MSTYTDASLIVTPNAKKAGKLYALKGADLDVVRATTATYVGSDGLIKTALANEVRFDYTNGSCPSILVEPQRTNLALRSNELNVSPWTNTAVATNASASLSPSGSGSFKIIPNTTNTNHYIQQSVSVVSGTTYTISFFAKADGYNYTSTFISALGIGSFWDLQNGIAGSGASIINYGNGWYRCVATGVATTTGLASFRIYAQNSNISSFAGNGIDGVLVWGAQLEAGANATSYIQTVASSVTRIADVISKTGISSLIGQTEGTIFCDVNLNNLPIGNQSALILGFNSNVDSVRIRFGVSKIEGLIFYNSSVVAQIIQNISQTGRYKIALSYNNNYAALFVNGVKVGQDLTVSTQNLSSIGLGSFSSGFEHLNNSINSALVFPTQLTDQECIALTTL